MCYTVYIATDFSQDLSKFNSEHLRPEQATPDEIKRLDGLFSLPLIWRLGSKTVCGCEFRHLMTENVKNFGFSKPEEWFGESSDQIEGTKQIYQLVKWILEQGGNVELADLWGEPEASSSIERLNVSLSEISEERFRLFEEHLFKLRL